MEAPGEMSQPTRPRSGGDSGRTVLATLALCGGVVLGCCGSGIIGYGSLGAIMVDQAEDDPWVVWSIVGGVVTVLLGVIALAVGVVLLARRRR